MDFQRNTWRETTDQANRSGSVHAGRMTRRRAPLAWYAVALLLVGCQTGRGRQRVEAPPPPMLGAADQPAENALDTENAVVTPPKDEAGPSPLVQTAAVETADGRHSVFKATETVSVQTTAGDSSPWESSLSLQGAVSIALTQNPDLIAARGQAQVNEAMVGVAETYIWNPFVQSQVRPGDRSYYVWLMQRFELAHQQGFREQAAQATLNQVQWTIHQTELMNLAQTTRLYLTALYQRELYQLANETAQLNDDLLGIVQRRFAAGLSLANQVTTAKVAARQSRNQARLADATYQTALLALRQQMNLSPSAPLVLTDRLADFSWRPAALFCTGGGVPLEQATDPHVERTQIDIELCDISGFGAGPGSTDGDGTQPGPAPHRLSADRRADLARNLAAGRPDVMAALAGVSAMSANYRLANAARVPDLQAGPIYTQNGNGTNDLGFRVQMDLPIWNTGGPLARQRRVEVQQQNRVYTQLRVRAAREAETAIDRYERARLLAAESQVDLSPFSEKMPPDLAEIKAQFEAGQADVLAVFATQNSLLQDRRTYLDLLNELAQSAAAVVQATALPVERLIAPNDEQLPPWGA